MDLLLTVGVNALTVIVALIAFNYTKNKDLKDKDLKLESRIQKIETEFLNLKEQISDLSKTIKQLNDSVIFINDIKSGLKDIQVLIQSMSNSITKHEVEIRNLKDE